MSSRAGQAVPARSAESLAAEFGAAYRARSTRTEILMGDFYGGRPIILKFIPWWGRVLEAGCGLGRYVFYLRRLGYDAHGVEISEEALEACREHARATGEDPLLFDRADVRALDLPASSQSCYISLGVVEHFQEGPERALAEAHRVLAPGGVAIICTPNRWSVEHLTDSARHGARVALERILAAAGISRESRPRPFDQYWFSSARLARFARRAGLTVTLRRTVDLKYAVHETLKMIGAAPAPDARRRLFRLLDTLESTPVRVAGGLAFIIAVKEASDAEGARRCFFCGAPRVPEGRLLWTVPVCLPCARRVPRDVLREYAPGRPGRFSEAEPPGEAGLPLSEPGEARCSLCGRQAEPDPHFGLYGLARPVCRACLASPEERSRLVLYELREQWRPRL